MKSVLIAWLFALIISVIAVIMGNGCEPAAVHVDTITCPIEVPKEIVAAYFGCVYDEDDNLICEAVCTPVSKLAPQLTVGDLVDAGLLVTTDGGEQ